MVIIQTIKYNPSGTITDIIEEYMSNNKTSLDESIQMIVYDILNNESMKIRKLKH